MLPGPYIPDDPRLRLITIRHVLSHTPGFPNWRPRDRPLRIHFAPGERFAYSGEGYVYLQRVIEHVTGLNLDKWMRTLVMDLRGMHSSSYVWTDAYETLAARGHDDKGKPQQQGKMTKPNAAYSLYTTPSEFASFVIALLEPPSAPSYLDRDQIARMLVPQVPVNDAGFDAERSTSEVTLCTDVSWGLGWGLQHTPGRDAFWHWGDNGSFQAFVMGFPRVKSGMVCMANGTNGRALWHSLYTALFGRMQPAISWLAKLYGGAPTAPIVTIEEAADYLRIHPLTARRLARYGELPAFKVGRQWRIKRALLDAWLVERSMDNLTAHQGSV
jgi:excisionase family DNA binding protein